MLHNFDQMLHIFALFSINIGDLIFTGTPAGVANNVVGDSSGIARRRKHAVLEIINLSFRHDKARA
jgi:2-keto-4-pentenoate hydratase/2-oxohepta-3-ene-1,7-dioic acid hydratase in catechol pathway